MKKRRIKFSEIYNGKDRPYYIMKDNDNSRIRISKVSNYKSIEEILQDKKLTKALVTSMAINEVHVIDHIIVAGDDSYSVSKELEN